MEIEDGKKVEHWRWYKAMGDGVIFFWLGLIFIIIGIACVIYAIYPPPFGPGAFTMGVVFVIAGLGVIEAARRVGRE